MEGDARRWSRTAQLVAWAVWQIVVSIPMSERGSNGGNIFLNWLKRNQPPGFLPPKMKTEGPKDRWLE
jgi:hypothetical protein